MTHSSNVGADASREWQDIETAPKSGTFLVAGRWNVGQPYDGKPWWNIAFGQEDGPSGDWDVATQPSHWMPLLTPPAWRAEMSDASHKSVPEWAIDRAVDLLKQAGAINTEDYIRGTYAARAFAAYIAEHEEAPVDPLAVGLADAMNHSVDRLGIFEPDEAEDLIAELGRRGFKIVEASK